MLAKEPELLLISNDHKAIFLVLVLEIILDLVRMKKKSWKTTSKKCVVLSFDSVILFVDYICAVTVSKKKSIVLKIVLPVMASLLLLITFTWLVFKSKGRTLLHFSECSVNEVLIKKDTDINVSIPARQTQKQEKSVYTATLGCFQQV